MNEKKPIVKKPEYVPVTKAFPNEARDLTPWLEKNIDALGARLNLTLSVEQREKAVGDFKVDLLCKDDAGNKVIVENQVYATDHNHLGKLLTYLVNLDAKTAIWVTSDPRPEHQKVVEWLNETMPDDMSFYLVKVEALRTVGLVYSPVFSLLTGPDKQAKKVGEEKKEWAQIEHDRFEFCKKLLEHPKIKGTVFAGREPSKRNYISVPAGVPGFRFGFSVNRNDAFVYMAFMFEDAKMTNTLFQKLAKQKHDIEKEFGEKLVWSGLEGNNWPWIGREFHSGVKERQKWPALHDDMVDAMRRLVKVLQPRLKKAYEGLK